MTSRDKRLARNESLYREVNERISEVNAVFDVDGRADYLCECGRPDCTDTMSLTHGEYERVRTVPTHFFVKPGHEDPSVERVVQQNDGYLVVQKLGEAAEEAASSDPRP